MKTTTAIILISILMSLPTQSRSDESLRVAQNLETSDVFGEPYLLNPKADSTPAVYVMLGTDCVISRRLIPTLNELASMATENNIKFYGVLADDWSEPLDGQLFVNEYEIQFPLLMDDTQKLAGQLKPRVRPEAFVFNESGALVYQGRIDNRFERVGVLRNLITQNDLKDALLAITKGELPEIRDTTPIGCVYPPWEKKPINKIQAKHDHNSANQD